MLMRWAPAAAVSPSADAAAMPLLPEARDMARWESSCRRLLNRAFLEGKLKIQRRSLDLLDIMFDPQTSGGLLIAVPEEHAAKLLADLQCEIPAAAIVGRIVPPENYIIHIE